MLSDVIIDGTTSVKDSVIANGDSSVSYTFDNVMSNYTITASFEEDEKAPVITTNSVTDRTTSAITVNAKATDADSDTLTYTLYTKKTTETSYTSKATTSAAQNTAVTLTASGLDENTKYNYYFTVSDGVLSATSSVAEAATWCSGTGEECVNTTSCSATESNYSCWSCTDGYVACDGTVSLSNSYVTSVLCDSCRKQLVGTVYEYQCSNVNNGCSQGEQRLFMCDQCSETMGNIEGTCTALKECSNCGGDGTRTELSPCSSHSRTDTHYYCTEHNYVGTNSAHVVCTHGYTESHDYVN